VRARRHRISLPRVVVVLAVASCAGGDPVQDEVLLQQIPALHRSIEKWRQLEFTEPVVAEWKEHEQEHIKGWYEPTTKRLYLSPAAEGRFGEGVLIHELYHALQDQHYDLQAVHARAGDDEERNAVADALIEGEAMLAVMELLDYDFESMAAAVRDPEKRERASPYLIGALYVRTLRDACGWPAVERAYRSPPASREEMQEVAAAGGERITCPAE